MNFVISILLKLASTVVKNVICDADKVYGIMLHFSQVTHLSPQRESKCKNSECLI